LNTRLDVGRATIHFFARALAHFDEDSAQGRLALDFA
jgi:hypothetical protein